MNGMIEWFARNPVAANLLMLFIMVAGLIGMFNVRGETFPEIELDMVSIQVPYLGAAPEEVEEGVCIRIEEAIQGIDGIEQIISTANEGSGTVMVEVALGSDTRRVLDDIKTNVDAIETFPEETEKPIITELLARFRVVDIAVSGQTDEFTLKSVAERVRDDLAAQPGISQVEFASARPYEISIEVSEDTLRRHGLSFDDVSQRRAPLVTRHAGRLGAQRERRDPPPHDRPGVPRRGVREAGAHGAARRDAAASGRRRDRRRRLRRDGSIRTLRTASRPSSSRSSAPASRATWRSPARWTTTWPARRPACRRGSR